MNYFKRQRFLPQAINEVKFVNGYFFYYFIQYKGVDIFFIDLKRSYDTMQTGNKFMNIDEENKTINNVRKFSFDEEKIYLLIENNNNYIIEIR